MTDKPQELASRIQRHLISKGVHVSPSMRNECILSHVMAAFSTSNTAIKGAAVIANHAGSRIRELEAVAEKVSNFCFTTEFEKQRKVDDVAKAWLPIKMAARKALRLRTNESME